MAALQRELEAAHARLAQLEAHGAGEQQQQQRAAPVAAREQEHAAQVRRVGCPAARLRAAAVPCTGDGRSPAAALPRPQPTHPPNPAPHTPPRLCAAGGA